MSKEMPPPPPISSQQVRSPAGRCVSRVSGADSIQGDVRFAEALAADGCAHVEMGPNWIEARAPAGGRLQAIDLDCNHMPDAAMTLAVVTLFADGTTRLTQHRQRGASRKPTASPPWRPNCASWVRPGGGGRRLLPSPCPSRSAWRRPAATDFLRRHAAIDTYDDHRIAMCFSLACARRRGRSRINDPTVREQNLPGVLRSLSVGSLLRWWPSMALRPRAKARWLQLGRRKAGLSLP
jgi:3-phosphoshikimate 1-carboxyvinyltransferase